LSGEAPTVLGVLLGWKPDPTPAVLLEKPAAFKDKPPSCDTKVEATDQRAAVYFSQITCDDWRLTAARHLDYSAPPVIAMISQGGCASFKGLALFFRRPQ
jgi:hypothetical protein